MDPYRFYETRTQKLQESIREADFDAFLTFDPVNIRYLSGFSGSSAVLFFTEKERLFCTDFRYKTQAESTIRNYDIHIYPEQMNYLAETIGKFDSVRKIGIESDKLSISSFEDLEKKVLSKVLVPSKSMVENLRLIKDELEIHHLRSRHDKNWLS